ncbi:aminotransferase class III-fold pyridoxal phosphate-dependent enzyme [Croceicoccus mobilis]|uniref:Aspartate aminotransferase family protein n=1 Tax=Croceicoccus mobilis TaxID=1703339 RepID=A0A916Z0R8_9SPHN|nr:aminotransferase class III-fold pyridoxal phosphate-dependent enzyme [Croceicoccus mobilis]GGD70214.1 aspartate aminotransferase family protein [Croceicoccus mobilis]
MIANSLIENDRAHWIHPVASWRKHEDRGATVLQSGKGVFLTDIEGNTLLDGFAGLWCVNVGYGHDSIVDVATEQMRRLPYATGYFHFGSEPAIELATKLAERAPGDLNHVYFSLGGSDAVDSVVRLVRYYYNITKRPEKKHMIALERGYHGSSSTGSGLTAIPSFHAGFDVPTPMQHHIPCPYPYRTDYESDAELIAASVQHLKDKVAEIGADKVAAFFAEPVVGSGGVIVPPKGWLTAMQAACRELDILFITDEVITGFGRTGPLFAAEHEGLEPDFMTVAKGLTSGYAPMGALFMSDRIYQAIAEATPYGTPIGHGMTYSGHPVSAAVGLEVLRLYEEGGIIANGQKSGDYFATKLAGLLDHPLVGDVRSQGLLAGVELVTCKKDKTRPDAALDVPDRLAKIGYDNGLIFRAFGDGIVGFAPPLCITTDEVDLMMQRFERSLDDLLEVKEIRDAVK